MALECSTHGGEAIVASAWTVYNELAATRPDLIHTLAQPDWPFDTLSICIVQSNFWLTAVQVWERPSILQQSAVAPV